jgi:hypothetical protein
MDLPLADVSIPAEAPAVLVKRPLGHSVAVGHSCVTAPVSAAQLSPVGRQRGCNTFMFLIH